VVALLFVGTSLLASSFLSTKIGLIEEKGVLGGPSPTEGNIVIAAADAADKSSFSTSFEENPIANQVDGKIISSSYNLADAAIKDPTSLKNTATQAIGSVDTQKTPRDKTLPNFNKEFVMPVTGYNWGVLHEYNAVDIAALCGTPVRAAAEGVVIPDPQNPDITDGWNGGYGNFILIQHPFGTGVETRYAHLQSATVKIGDYVQQGQEIGLMGETGAATSCHLHFEVIGAQNPFVK
jgi:murein DD-endopeptidase MepM/ murein hydrolase activator NlpD